MERDEKINADVALEIDFNSHAHVERDLLYFVLVHIPQDFNSHAHVERDT